MKKIIQIILKDKTIFELQVESQITNETNLQIHKHLSGSSPLLLEIQHQQLNTILDLTKVSPFVLLYFEDVEREFKFSGASFSLNESGSPFSILATSKKILLLRYPISFDLANVSTLIL